MDLDGFIEKINGLFSSSSLPSLVIIDKYPWTTPTIVGRLVEELGTDHLLILTNKHVSRDVIESLEHIDENLKAYNSMVIVDSMYGYSLIQDNIFDTVFNINKLLNSLRDRVNKIVIDLTGSDGSIATAIIYSAHKILGDRVVLTTIDNIPLYGIPAYPGSPRWLHRVYVYGNNKVEGKGPIVNEYPRNIEWRGSRGIYIALSKVFNTLTSCGCVETYYMDRRSIVSRNNRLEAWISMIGAMGEKRRLFSLDELNGPDQNTSSMIYNAWKNISELLSLSMNDVDKQSIDRLIMQIQRYVGAADLVIKEAASSSPQWFDSVGEKLHRIILSSSSEKNRLAIVPDTNLFYQGIHMVLLKASIRQGNPWSPLRNVSIYIPICAETEINGKVAETNPDSGGLQRISYIMALLANRALLETRYYYDAKTLPATSQPCEASMAVEAPTLPEQRILLITADHKAFTAWQTLNICRGKVACGYIGHSDKPLDTDTIYGRFYTSISLSLLLYVSSLFLPATLKGSRGEVKLLVKSLKGSNAPVISVHRLKEQ
jgi:hypothetical protein